MQHSSKVNKVYIIYYDYSNTTGNHSGMAYLARYLDKEIANVRLIRNIPQEYKFGRYVARIYSFFLSLYLAFILNEGDKVFFLEYLAKDLGHQVLIAKALRFFKLNNKFLALVHYPGQFLLELYGGKENILRSLSPINELFVFGSSLALFFEDIDAPCKINTTFHYVDTGFYQPVTKKNKIERINVLSVGNLKRDFPKLKQIVLVCPDLLFHICMGKKKLEYLFRDVKNVVLHSYLSEIELLHLMQNCNVSISVMDDTIGSNAITTSMAVGLVQVVSDVGSIRDYCTSMNAFFCHTADDFVITLNKLNQNKAIIETMSNCAVADSLKFSKESFLEKFKDFTQV